MHAPGPEEDDGREHEREMTLVGPTTTTGHPLWDGRVTPPDMYFARYHCPWVRSAPVMEKIVLVLISRRAPFGGAGVTVPVSHKRRGRGEGEVLPEIPTLPTATEDAFPHTSCVHPLGTAPAAQDPAKGMRVGIVSSNGSSAAEIEDALVVARSCVVVVVVVVVVCGVC